MSSLAKTAQTTDALFRETAELIAARREEGIAVEMEAAALLAMGTALKKPVVCVAHITNSMATKEDDFKKRATPEPLDACFLCRCASGHP